MKSIMVMGMVSPRYQVQFVGSTLVPPGSSTVAVFDEQFFVEVVGEFGDPSAYA
jgi:hypothetical protein